MGQWSGEGGGQAGEMTEMQAHLRVMFEDVRAFLLAD